MQRATFCTKAQAQYWSGLFLCLIFGSTAFAACLPQGTPTKVEVTGVIDGDTVKLANGELVRIIGINTPERRSKYHDAEPYAAESTRILQQLISSHNDLASLYLGQQPEDKHGRTLGHLVVAGDVNLAEAVLKEGVAAYVAVAPNTELAACYRRVENRARAERKGIWRDEIFVLQADDISAKTKGFKIVSGVVTDINQRKKLVIISMGSRFQFVIFAKHFKKFSRRELSRLQDKRVEVRGWVGKYRGQPQIVVSSPFSVSVVD